MNLNLRMRGVKGDDARAEEYSNTLEEKLKGYEAILSKQKYLAGNVSNLNKDYIK